MVYYYVPELEVIVVATLSVGPPVLTPGSFFPENRDGTMREMRKKGDLFVPKALGQYSLTELTIIRDESSVIRGAAPCQLNYRGRNVPRPGPDRIPLITAVLGSKCSCF